jgi:hypothetical protein
MPVMLVRRWFTLLLQGKSRKLIKEINVVRTASDEKTDATVDMLSKLGL